MGELAIIALVSFLDERLQLFWLSFGDKLGGWL